MKLLETYPTKLKMTRRRFDEKLTFVCGACIEVVNSYMRVQTLDGIICEECYHFRVNTAEKKKPTGYRHSKLTWAQVESICRDTRPQTVIAADYGISQGSVSKVKNGKSW